MRDSVAKVVNNNFLSIYIFIPADKFVCMEMIKFGWIFDAFIIYILSLLIFI